MTISMGSQYSATSIFPGQRGVNLAEKPGRSGGIDKHENGVQLLFIGSETFCQFRDAYSKEIPRKEEEIVRIQL